jgi:hypothetical protein
MHCYTYLRKYHGHVTEDDSGCDERRLVGAGNERDGLGSLQGWLGVVVGRQRRSFGPERGSEVSRQCIGLPEGKTAVWPVAVTGAIRRHDSAHAQAGNDVKKTMGRDGD